MPRRASILGWALATIVVALLAACSGDSAPPPTPTASVAAVDPDLVVVEMTTGCARPQPELGTEALALVRVTYPGDVPVIAAQVEGDIVGPAVAIRPASDATTLAGEALMFFVVTELGEYTITVERITLPNGAEAKFDASSTLSATFEVGEVCVPPRF